MTEITDLSMLHFAAGFFVGVSFSVLPTYFILGEALRNFADFAINFELSRTPRKWTLPPGNENLVAVLVTTRVESVAMRFMDTTNSNMIKEIHIRSFSRSRNKPPIEQQQQEAAAVPRISDVEVSSKGSDLPSSSHAEEIQV